jgi:uncharacterized protein (TIGR02147 family)
MSNTLDSLIALDLIQVNDEGLLYRSNGATFEKNMQSLNDIAIPNVHQYYHDVFSLALEAIASPVDQREFQCFNLILNSHQLIKYKQMVREFRKKLLEEFKSEAETNTLYQVNLQLFPVTSEIH